MDLLNDMLQKYGNYGLLWVFLCGLVVVTFERHYF